MSNINMSRKINKISMIVVIQVGQKQHPDGVLPESRFLIIPTHILTTQKILQLVV